MQKIEAGAPESQSADLVAENIAQLRALFPELVTESADGMAVNVDVLKQLVGDQTVTDAEEKYGLNWHGKRRARQLALIPSTGTLRPCPEDSVDWDTTQNLMIEGDNLEVLKLLQKSYSGRVKLIYIDPPYNTGKDFVYPDNFQDNIRNYLEITGQVEGDRKITSNAETSGRFHTDWLAMMYPRLKLARNLLSKDGVLFISIDDSEVANLREICDEILGEENFLACFIWKSRQNKDNRTLTGASIDHEYMLCYGQGVRGDARKIDQYSNPDNDPRGDWTSANMVGIATADRRPNLHYDLIDPETQTNYGCPKLGWRFEPKTMERLIAEGRILWPKDSGGRPRRKAFLSELTSEFTGFSTIIGSEVFTRDGTRDIDDLFGLRVFDFPKPVELLQSLVEQATSHGDIVLDFFAGSGSSAQAVLTQNNADGGTRRYILIQLPEQLDPNNPDQRTGAEFCRKHKLPLHISEITKERLRRVSKKLRKESSLTTLDLGFRVFKLDSTNIREWDTAPTDLTAELELHTEHMKEGRSEADILYELLLKLGLDLCVPMEERTVSAGKRKHRVTAIGGGVLMACLSESIPQADVETLGLSLAQWHEELAPAGDTTCVFRDSAFEDDVAKTNMAAILTQHGFTRVRSL